MPPRPDSSSGCGACRRTYAYQVLVLDELDMRSSLLDIQLTPNNRPAPSTPVFRMHIQPRNRFCRSQHHRQLQFCVPLVTLKGDSNRIKDRDLGRVPGSSTEE